MIVQEKSNKELDKDAINGHGPTAFVRKAIQEQKKGKTSVLILPVLSLLNMLFEAKAEIRPVGRVKWIHAETGEQWKQPSNCALFILRGEKNARTHKLTKKI